MSLSKRLREAASNLAEYVRLYRLAHDLHGGSSINSGRAWDRMRRAEDELRKVLAEPAADALEAQGEWVSVERSMLERIPRESIAMFQEYRDQYGRAEDDALVAACNEILEGINAYLSPTPPTEDAL